MTVPTEHGPQASQLCELKLLSTGATWHHAADKTVEFRARQLPRSYIDKAKNIDKVCCRTGDGQVGPIQQTL